MCLKVPLFVFHQPYVNMLDAFKYHINRSVHYANRIGGIHITFQWNNPFPWNQQAFVRTTSAFALIGWRTVFIVFIVYYEKTTGFPFLYYGSVVIALQRGIKRQESPVELGVSGSLRVGLFVFLCFKLNLIL